MNRQIVQEAATWFVEFNADSPDLATRKRFDTWLRASPEHVRAFLEIIPIWEDGRRLPLDPDATPEQLVRLAREAANVIQIQPAAASGRDTVEPERGYVGSRGRRRFRWLAPIAAALAGAVFFWGYRELHYPTYATGIGEQRSLVLSDSSTVDLDALSRIRIHYSRDEREIDLLQGQALFHVAKNAARPFLVHSGETRVRAVGTEFDVYRKTAATVITVVEGRVSVYSSPDGGGAGHPGPGSGPAVEPISASALRAGAAEPVNPSVSVLLDAGEQITVSSKAVEKADRLSVMDATAWTQRQLAFDSTPLTEVAEEFNRYNTRRLRIDAASLGDFRISGIFSSTDPASLVRFLREQPGIKVVESDDEIRVQRD